MFAKSFICIAALASVTGLAVSTASAQITIPTVRIGNPGNAANGGVYGSVAYVYNIGRTEVTNAQYAAFLNAKAASDPFGLYSTNMAGLFGGITRSGPPGSYTYSTVAGRANHPVNFVSFWDACRFANWLHNGQGNGDTETGAYTLTPNDISANTVTRNANWRWAVTTENEWYKAAFFQPASAGGPASEYWDYPNSSSSITTSQANFNNVIGNTRAVGSYVPNFFGAFDLGGNVEEWNDSTDPLNWGEYERGARGGSFDAPLFLLDAAPSCCISRDSYHEDRSTGLRISERVFCPGDYNRDGAVDFFDYLDFVSAFDVEAPNADFNGDSAVDFFDYLDFVGAFDADC